MMIKIDTMNGKWIFPTTKIKTNKKG